MDLPSLAALAWPVLLKGTGYTLVFAVASMLLGLPLAGLITLVRTLRVPLLHRLMTFYVSASTPAVRGESSMPMLGRP